MNFHFETLLDIILQLFRKRSSAAKNILDAADIVLCRLGSFAEHDEDGRRGLQLRDFVILDGLEEIGVDELFHDVNWDVEFDAHQDSVELAICVIQG